MAYVGLNEWTLSRKSGGIPSVSTRFSLSMDNEQADVGRDSWTRLARPTSQARMGTGKCSLPYSADHEQYWQPCTVDPHSAVCDDHAYIHTIRRRSRRREVRASRGLNAGVRSCSRGLWHGEQETAEMRGVRTTGGGRGLRGEAKKEWMGYFLDNLRAFAINADQWTTPGLDKGEWRKTAEQGAGRFMMKWIAAEKVRAGLRHAVVCPNNHNFVR